MYAVDPEVWYDRAAEESVDPALAEALARLRGGTRFYVRLNRRAKLTRPAERDVLGIVVRDAEYAPRWELWEHVEDSGGRREGRHRVMSLVTAEGGYREPGQWLVEYLRRYNPERYGGSIARMLRDVAKEGEEVHAGLSRSEIRELSEWGEEYTRWFMTPGTHRANKSVATKPIYG